MRYLCCHNAASLLEQASARLCRNNTHVNQHAHSHARTNAHAITHRVAWARSSCACASARCCRCCPVDTKCVTSTSVITPHTDAHTQRQTCLASGDLLRRRARDARDAVGTPSSSTAIHAIRRVPSKTQHAPSSARGDVVPLAPLRSTTATRQHQMHAVRHYVLVATSASALVMLRRTAAANNATCTDRYTLMHTCHMTPSCAPRQAVRQRQ
jgi:hypothetical protein